MDPVRRKKATNTVEEKANLGGITNWKTGPSWLLLSYLDTLKSVKFVVKLTVGWSFLSLRVVGGQGSWNLLTENLRITPCCTKVDEGLVFVLWWQRSGEREFIGCRVFSARDPRTKTKTTKETSHKRFAAVLLRDKNGESAELTFLLMAGRNFDRGASKFWPGGWGSGGEFFICLGCSGWLDLRVKKWRNQKMTDHNYY